MSMSNLFDMKVSREKKVFKSKMIDEVMVARDSRPSLKRDKLEFKRQSCVFWILCMYKTERKKLEFPEMRGSSLTGGVRTPQVGHFRPFLEILVFFFHFYI